MRAYMAAKTYHKSNKKHGDDYVTKMEFRILLKYLRKYYELWIAFDKIDSSGDRRVSNTEFMAAKPLLQRWGINMSNPDAQWKKCDADGHGMVLFIEFADWSIKQHLDLDNDDDKDNND